MRRLEHCTAGLFAAAKLVTSKSQSSTRWEASVSCSKFMCSMKVCHENVTLTVAANSGMLAIAL